jgi:hypothetical protein
MGAPAIFRFTGGKSATAARYIVIFNGVWAIREHEWDLEGTGAPLVWTASSKIPNSACQPVYC